MELQKIRIRSISKTNYVENVYDLSVPSNHNFFIGKTQTLTHNCASLTINAQSALLNLLEVFSANTRFILTCNYIEKIIPPIQSRCQTFEIIPPTKSQVAKRVVEILDLEKVDYTREDLKLIINANYPDIRSILQTCQLRTIDGKLTVDAKTIIEVDYLKKIIDLLVKKQNQKTLFTDIRQVIVDAGIRDFTSLYRHLFDNLELYAKGHIAPVILIIAEAQYRDTFCVDKEISVSAMFVQLIAELDF